MNDHLKSFANHSAYSAAESQLIKPNVSLCVQENEVHYNPIPDPSKMYLTFDILTDGTVYWNHVTFGPDNSISYSLDEGNTWISMPIATTLNVQTGDKILFKGENNYYGYQSDELYYDRFGGTAQFNVSGNIMSLIYGDNFVGQTVLPIEDPDFEPEHGYTYEATFYRLFYSAKVVNAKDLILPATSLTNECYGSMFQNCTTLITVPKLPSTTLTKYCYQNMFSGCTSLTSAPELPATILINNCYNGMFYGCTALVNTPELLATTPAAGCYDLMFSGCTNVNYIKCLLAGTDLDFYYWTNGVAANGTFIKNANATWATGADGIPSGWTVQDVS